VIDYIELLEEAQRLLATGLRPELVDGFVRQESGFTVEGLSDLRGRVGEGETEGRPLVPAFSDELKGGMAFALLLNEFVKGVDINTVIPKTAGAVLAAAAQGAKSMATHPFRSSLKVIDALTPLLTNPGEFTTGAAAVGPFARRLAAKQVARSAAGEIPVFRVAIRTEDGKLITGKMGEIHSMVAERVGMEKIGNVDRIQSMGFVTAENPTTFLNRAEALELAGLGDEVRAGRFVGTAAEPGLHSFEAPGIREPIPEQMIRLNRRHRGEDPFGRTGLSSGETKRRLDDPEGFVGRSNFNVVEEGLEPERAVRALPRSTDFDIAASRFYDIQADPLKLKEGLNTFGSDLNRLEQRIKNQGFIGYVEAEAGGNFNRRAVVFTDDLGELKRVREAPIEDAPIVRTDDPPVRGQRVFEDPPASPTPLRAGAELDDLVARQSQAHIDSGSGGGSTFNLESGLSEVGNDVWPVAFEKGSVWFDEAPTPAQLRNFIKNGPPAHKKGAKLGIGTWDDLKGQGTGRDGRPGHEVSWVQIFPGDELARAQEFATAEKQFGFINMARPDFKILETADISAQYVAELDNMYIATTADGTQVNVLGARSASEVAGVVDFKPLDIQPHPRRVDRMRRFTENSTPEELEAFRRHPSGRSVSKVQQQDILDVFSMMPETDDAVSLALLGAEGRNFYRQGANGIQESFGNDALRFTHVLASTSPNIGVFDSLRGALAIWRDWLRAGKPQDLDVISRIVDDAATATGITPTNFNNVARSLTATTKQLMDPKLAGLSGGKVPPFSRNLLREMQVLTWDTHMKSVFGAGGTRASVREIAGATPRMREYAGRLSEITGEPWSLAQVQAAMWAPLLEIRAGQGARGAGRAQQFIEELQLGGMAGIRQGMAGRAEMGPLREGVARQPSFMEMLNDPKVADIMGEIGVRPPTVLNPDMPLGFDPDKIRAASITSLVKRLDLVDTPGAKPLIGAPRKSLAVAAAALVAAGQPEAAEAGTVQSWGELGMAIATEAGVSQEALDAMAGAGPGATADYLSLMAQVPGASYMEIARFGRNMGYANAGEVARAIVKDVGVPAGKTPPPALSVDVRALEAGIVEERRLAPPLELGVVDAVPVPELEPRVQPPTMQERADSIISDPSRTPSVPGRFLEGARQAFPVKQIEGLLNLVFPGEEEEGEPKRRVNFGLLPPS